MSKKGGRARLNRPFCRVKVRAFVMMAGIYDVCLSPFSGGQHSAWCAAMVVNVSPNCMNMELIRAISSGLLPSAMQQARVDMERASSQDCKTNYLLVVI